MTSPRLASTDALGVRLGVTLAGTDLARAGAVLDDASALIRWIATNAAEADTPGAAGWLTDDDPPVLDTANLPDIVVTVCLSVAERAWRNPDGLRSESLGSYAVTYAGSDLAGVFLTANERALIRGAVGSSSVGSIEMQSPYPRTVGGYVPVDAGGEVPWVTLGDDDAY
jgi:hypothetical protein